MKFGKHNIPTAQVICTNLYLTVFQGHFSPRCLLFRGFTTLSLSLSLLCQKVNLSFSLLCQRVNLSLSPPQRVNISLSLPPLPKGHPFMASLLENKPLLYSLLATTTVLFLLATGFMPELGVFLEISPFTDEVSTVTFHAVLYI